MPSISPSSVHPLDPAERKLPLLLKLVLLPFLPLSLALSVCRVVLFVLTMVFMWCLCRVATIGMPTPEGISFAPLSGARRAWFVVAMRAIGRTLLLSAGVWPGLLRVRGEPDAAAPVWAMAPHMGMVDGFLGIYLGTPRPVILAPYAKVPLLYSLLRAANALLVPVAAARPKGGGGGGEKKEAAAAAAPAAGGEAPKKRTNAVRDAITSHKAAFKSGDVPICILPEGTCTNGRSIVKFFSGAFEGGTPVQPITIQYPFDYYNGGAFLTTLPAHLLKVFLNPWMTVDAAFLPLYSPDAAEAADGDLMAENVRKAMGAASAVPLSPLGAKELREFLAQGSKEGKAT